MPKANIITGLDIGSATIKLLSVVKRIPSQSNSSLTEEEKNIEVLSKVQEISFGVRRGVVVDVERLSEVINSLVRKAEEECGKKIEQVYANVGGNHLFCYTSHGLVSVSRADQKISEEDIARVLQAAQTFSLPSNKEILEIFSKEFIVDGEKVKEPLGMNAVRLEVNALVIGGFSPYLKNLNQALLNSNLQVLDLIPAPLASARAVLTPKEKELGVLLLDIGAGTTSLCLFEEGDLTHLAVLPIGSANITNDIAICLKTDIDTAEKIKIQFSAGLLEKKGGKRKGRRKEQIKIESIDPKESLFFNNKRLTQIIEVRICEILREVQKELKRIGKAGLLPGGVVLTGGGAKLPKIKDFTKKILKLPCRIALPRQFSPEIDDPSFASVCGLVLEGFDSLEEKGSFSISKTILGKLKRFFRIFIP